MSRARRGKKRCAFCPAPATVWLWYTTTGYPSTRKVRTNAASCDAHESCPHFDSMKRLVADKSPEIVRAGAHRAARP